MWIALSLLSALAAALSGLALKRALDGAGVVISTIAFRGIAGLLLAALTLLAAPPPTPSPLYWRTAALVMVPEIGGMVCYGLALRAGQLSQVQPLLGLIPLFVTLGGALFLGEIPTPLASVGVLLVTGGVYSVGLRVGTSPFEPVRALVRSPAGWYALAASAAWSVTTVLHKVGIAEVGPFAWGVTLTLGSALVLVAALPALARRPRGLQRPRRARAWAWLVLLAGLFFAVHQAGLHLSLRAAQAGYVSALTAISSLLAAALGILVLRERDAVWPRLAGALLVSSGAALIALGG